jgi:hypothetical protein
VNFDVSLIKNTYIKERFRVEFRAESFNIENRVNLGLANDTFSAGPDRRNISSTFGTVNSSRDARIVQLAMKVIF